MGLISASSPFYTGQDFGLGEERGFGHGIADERFYYFQATSLMINLFSDHKPIHRWAKQGKALRDDGPKVIDSYCIGFLGYYAGPNIHIVDHFALADPLLSRLPVIHDINWRIGHFERQLPEGYLESLRSGNNQLANPSLRKFYDKLGYIIKGPLFDWQRIITAFKMSVGSYDSLLRAAEPIWYTKNISEVNQPKTLGTPWHGADIFAMPTHGIKIRMEKSVYATIIEISVDGNDSYDVIFLKKNTNIYETDISPRNNPPPGLAIYSIIVPDTIASAGFDAITISPISGDKLYSFGHIRVVEIFQK